MTLRSCTSIIPELPLKCSSVKLSKFLKLELESARVRQSSEKVYTKLFRQSTSYKDFDKNYIQKPRIHKKNPVMLEDFKVEENLRSSMFTYDAFKNLINPKRPYIDTLSPVKKKSDQMLTGFETIPKEEYSNYKLESMHHFRSTTFRIKRARENIKAAKGITSKYH